MFAHLSFSRAWMYTLLATVGGVVLSMLMQFSPAHAMTTAETYVPTAPEKTLMQSGVNPFALRQSLMYGGFGEDIHSLKKALSLLGYLSYRSVDSGVFDAVTHAAVVQFQCDQHIVCNDPISSGIVGPRTRVAISQAIIAKGRELSRLATTAVFSRTLPTIPNPLPTDPTELLKLVADLIAYVNALSSAAKQTGTGSGVGTTTIASAPPSEPIYYCNGVVSHDACEINPTNTIDPRNTLVCGQPPMPQCPVGLYCMMAMPMPITYANYAAMVSAGATLIHYGACTDNDGIGGPITIYCPTGTVRGLVSGEQYCLPMSGLKCPSGTVLKYVSGTDVAICEQVVETNPIDPLPPKLIACPMDAKICPDGSMVVRTGPSCTFAACPETTPPSSGGEGNTPIPVTTAKCVVSGCSGEICSDRVDMSFVCLWKPEYQCYKTAKCERQGNGWCGWTQTNELTQCLSSSSSGGGIGEYTL